MLQQAYASLSAYLDTFVHISPLNSFIPHYHEYMSEVFRCHFDVDTGVMCRAYSALVRVLVRSSLLELLSVSGCVC